MIGERVGGKYLVERSLGAGGMGMVWIAIQEPLDRRVALKVIRSADFDARSRARFEREAKILAGLRCPHVVTLFDFGEHDGAPYIVLELLDGQALRAHLARGAVAVEQALLWARDIACGLRSAHGAGIIHRDLKPENVMLVPDRDVGARAKLLDFGIAKPLQSVAGDDMTQTGIGALVGTPGYIAPEVVLRGASDDPRLDFYALGVVMFEMICGAPPFQAATALALITAHATQPAPDVRERRPDAPAPLVALVARLLAKDPETRPHDAEALIGYIDALRVGCAPTTGMRPLKHAATGAAFTLPDRPSIAVQPFAAPGGTEDDELFAEGVAEDILTALSRFKQLFVMSQGTMVQPAGRDTDALRVGRALGVHYVIHGSVRRAGERLRVAVKLLDVQSGAQLWADRYDRPAGDVFEVQDEITQRVVASVAGHVEAAQGEHARRKPPHAMLAYDWLARGRAYHHRRTLEDNQRSREALDRAVEIDPDYAQAHAWRACAYGQAGGMGVQPMGAIVATFTHSITRAIALDDTDSECHRLGCEIAFTQRDLVRAEHHHRRAIELNPNDARIVGQAGELATYSGDLDEARDALTRAMRLDPLGPSPYMRLLVRALYLRGDLDEAWRLWRCIDDRNPGHLGVGAAIAALRGEPTDAQALVDQLRAASPGWSAKAMAPRFSDPSRLACWLRGYDAAGLA